jgi:hypothetical protein
MLWMPNMEIQDLLFALLGFGLALVPSFFLYYVPNPFFFSLLGLELSSEPFFYVNSVVNPFFM